MAFQAHKADLVPYEHPGIGRSVRFVTGRAPTYAGGHVLERKRSPLVSVAGEASLFVGVSCLQLMLPGAPVRCMAVHTTNRTLAESMAEGPLEGCPLGRVTARTQLVRTRHQEASWFG